MSLLYIIMTLSDHNYLKSAFGAGQFYYPTFQKDLENSSFNSQIRGFSNGKSSVTITIESITGGQQTELDNIVANHNPDYSKHRKLFFTINPEIYSTKNSAYTVFATFEYQGSNNIGAIDYIDVVAKTSHDQTPYDIKVIELTNQKILVEKTNLSNTNYESINLGTISNIPTNKTLIEIQIRRNGGNSTKSIHLQRVIVYYNN